MYYVNTNTVHDIAIIFQYMYLLIKLLAQGNKMALCVAIFLMTGFGFVHGQVPVQSNMKTFSYAIKDGVLPGNTEKTLYQYKTGSGVITEQWFTGPAMNSDTRVRIYIDGESTASLDFQLYLAHGIGYNDTIENKYVPWGTNRMSHAASGGGLYNTYRIPYLKSFRVTVNNPKGGVFFYIIRGVENYPLVVGDLLLPSNTRLRLYKNVNVLLKPLEYITLASVNNSAGAIFQVTLAANSSDFTYLEACMRVKIDGGDVMYLSSGTEDFFLSAYYFNAGVFHMDNSGLTSFEGKGTLSAYKFFENDPVLFTKSVELIWRCGEVVRSAYGCPYDFFPPGQEPFTSTEKAPPKKEQYADTTVTTYTWVYEWSY